MSQVDLNQYKKFVQAVTSNESSSYDYLQRRIADIRNNTNANPSLLMTAAIGLGSETGRSEEHTSELQSH